MKDLPVMIAVACLLMSSAVDARADHASVVLGNEYGEVTYSRDAALVGLEQANLSAAMLMTENNNALIHGTLSTPVLEDVTPVDLSVGARLYLASLVEPDDDIMGIGFGASARYRLPLDWLPFLKRFPLHVSASIHFAPEITTSGSAIDITDLHVIRGELELTPSLDALVGLRTVDIDRDTGEEDIVDERLYVGLRARF